MDAQTPPLVLGSARRRTLDAVRVVPVFGAGLAIIAALMVFDFMLVRVARRHEIETGQRLFERGNLALRRGDPAEALESFRAAYNHSPSSTNYQMAFAGALQLNGRRAEGKAVLVNLLERLPAYGPANARMAKTLASEGDWRKAAWFYHRALYGEWPGSPDLHALRFELAELLAQHGDREQLLSEVVLLNATGPDAADSRRLAGLQLAAANWTSAEHMYRSLLRASKDDSELLAGLGRAQFGSGNYPAAERTLRQAVSAGSADPKVKSLLETAEAINALDPSRRGLDPAERHRRAHALASTVVAGISGCHPGNPLITEAEQSLARHGRVRNPLEAADSDLDLFDRLWNARQEMCGNAVKFPREIQLLASRLVK